MVLYTCYSRTKAADGAEGGQRDVEDDVTQNQNVSRKANRTYEKKSVKRSPVKTGGRRPVSFASLSRHCYYD